MPLLGSGVRLIVVVVAASAKLSFEFSALELLPIDLGLDCLKGDPMLHIECVFLYGCQPFAMSPHLVHGLTIGQCSSQACLH